jgi:hypothetical protein
MGLGSAAAQQPANSRVMGTVASVSANTVTVKTDAGASVNVTVPDTARVLRTAPGQKTLTGATKITVSDMAAGDRVLMVVAGDPPTASVVVVNKQSDMDVDHHPGDADHHHPCHLLDGCSPLCAGFREVQRRAGVDPGGDSARRSGYRAWRP